MNIYSTLLLRAEIESTRDLTNHPTTYSGGQNCPNDTSKNYLAQITTKNYKNN